MFLTTESQGLDLHQGKIVEPLSILWDYILCIRFYIRNVSSCVQKCESALCILRRARLVGAQRICFCAATSAMWGWNFLRQQQTAWRQVNSSKCCWSSFSVPQNLKSCYLYFVLALWAPYSACLLLGLLLGTAYLLCWLDSVSKCQKTFSNRIPFWLSFTFNFYWKEITVFVSMHGQHLWNSLVEAKPSRVLRAFFFPLLERH